MKIKNDLSILDAKPLIVYDGHYPSRKVLRQVDDEHSPYVIHTETMKVDSDGDTFVHHSFFNGKYFQHLNDAKLEFEEC